MKVTYAAVFEPRAPERRKLVDGLKKAGLRVSAALEPGSLAREQLVVLGPSVSGAQASSLARKVRAGRSEVLVLSAQRKGFKASFADGVLPLPVSANDLKLRLPELVKLLGVAGGKKKAPPPERTEVRAQEPILDPFTGFYTFNHFKEIVFVEVKRARRYGFPVAIALIAFDPVDVKVDRELHSQLMGGLALAVRRSLRDIDYPVQYGVDRVMLLLPHTDLQGALVVSRRICERVAKASLPFGKQVLRPTISIGVSAGAAKDGEFSFGDLAARAQTALENALSAGGNQVQFGSALDLTGQDAAGTGTASGQPS